jgi:hypothetical protein
MTDSSQKFTSTDTHRHGGKKGRKEEEEEKKGLTDRYNSDATCSGFAVGKLEADETRRLKLMKRIAEDEKTAETKNKYV